MPTGELKYANWGITMQEVPDEISLVFDISGCPHHCEGCHSKYLWDDCGVPVARDLSSIVARYPHLISCVCFMGGDQSIDDLRSLCDAVKYMGLKRCVYSGLPVTEANRAIFEGMKLEFYKLGEYREELGGLASKNTNQRFYKREGGKYIDITERFWEKPFHLS